MTVDELIGRLKPSKERINRNNGYMVAGLSLTEDELVARLSSHLKLSGGGDRSKEASSSGGKRGRGRGAGHSASSGSCGGSCGDGDLSDRGKSGDASHGIGGGNDGVVAHDE
jgi:hypothetical protein